LHSCDWSRAATSTPHLLTAAAWPRGPHSQDGSARVASMDMTVLVLRHARPHL